MKTKKSLGQHWLFDQPSLEKVIDAADIKKTDTILEIGPGRGPLTELLAEQSKQVFAVEKDERLVPGLRAQFALNDNVGIIEGDILRLDLRELPKDYKVVANIPYYLTSILFRTLLESTNPPKLMVLLVQKEVAERVAANPGQLSVLGVSVQLYGIPKLTAVVTKDKFNPPPKVDSAIIQISRRAKPKIDVEPEVFMRLVKAGFSQKRKTLRNSLAGGLRIKGGEAEALLTQDQIPPNARAQELDFKQWKSLYDAAQALHLF